MDSLNQLKINALESKNDFETQAIELFKFQAQYNPVYNSFLNSLQFDFENVTSLNQIPFLPIEFFKNHIIKTSNWQEQQLFKSSGTSGSSRSQHFIEDTAFYEKVSRQIFENQFGNLQEYVVLALLPNYFDQGHSSLVFMVNHFIKNGKSGSGFYLNNKEEMFELLENNSLKKILFGVTYALLDLAEKEDILVRNCKIIETGGMKGRKAEITRMELHERLQNGFGDNEIHSEYGMTELLSQAYGQNGKLAFPKWCRPLVREINDPFTINSVGSGGLNIIDMANVHSCAFIETQDLVEIGSDEMFEVKGRIDNSDLRGCSLLIS